MLFDVFVYIFATVLGIAWGCLAGRWPASGKAALVRNVLLVKSLA
jgi:hypothetical protein